MLGDRLYVADLKNKLIQVLDKRSGELLFRMATADSPDTAVHFPTNLAFSEASDLYVSDTGNFRVLRFDPDGGLVGSYGGVGKALGRFARPKGVAVDRAGRIYVTDAAFENIQVFSDDGKLLLFFGEPGSRPENINLPADLEIDYEHARFFQRYAAPGFNLEIRHSGDQPFRGQPDQRVWFRSHGGQGLFGGQVGRVAAMVARLYRISQLTVAQFHGAAR